MSDETSSQFTIGTPEVVEEARALNRALRRFMDSAAAATSHPARTASLVQALGEWSERLERAAGPEADSVWRKAYRNEPPALLPALDFSDDGTRLEGHVTFGRFHIGRTGVHGGAIGLVFDEIMGALAGSGGRTRTRTAYLHVDFRALAPIDKPLRVSAWFGSEEGRKRILRASLSDGDVLCAEAHGLWLALKPGQP